MRGFKRRPATIAATFIVFVLVGCTSNDNNPSPTGASPTAPSTASQPGETSEQSHTVSVMMLSIAGSGSRIFDAFHVNGDFTISSHVTETAGEGLGVFILNVVDTRNALNSEYGAINAVGEQETVVPSDGGTYRLEINAANVEYTIDVIE